jgi:hypothetical protein
VTYVLSNVRNRTITLAGALEADEEKILSS